MAHEHSEMGFLAGLAVADLVGTSIPVGLALATLTAGAALLPDLDHPSATAAHTFGPITRVLAAATDTAGYAIWRATSTELDKPPRDGHRTVTHTVVFALLAGLAFGAVGTIGRWGMLGALFVLASLAVRGITARGPREASGHRRRHRFHANAISVSLYAAAITAAAYFVVPQVDSSLLGECVALGCWVHCLGDSMTLYGCPWLWPIRIGGQRWRLLGIPHSLRFRTGTPEHDGEDRVRRTMDVAIVLLLVTLIPHSWHWLGATAHAGYVALVH